MGPRRYSSTATNDDDAVSTEGIEFYIDEELFTCHGRISAFDLSEFAGPAADAEGGMLDAGVMRILSDLMRVILGESTYRAVTVHRRGHRTPDTVMQQILMDIVGEATNRPSVRPSPSQGGRPATISPPAVSTWPGEQAAATEWEYAGDWTPPASPARPAPAPVPAAPAAGQVRVGPGIMARLATDGDIRFADDPPADTPDPMTPKRPPVIRHLSLARPAQIEEIPQTG